MLFNLADERNAHDVDVTVNGGKLTMDTIAGFGIMVMLNEEKTEGAGSPDSFTFGKYDGEYMTLELPAGSAAPTAVYSGFKFVKESTDGVTDTYILVPAASIGLNFTPMASVTLDSNLIFNIYIPAHAGLKSATLNGVSVKLEDAINGYYLVSTPLSAPEAAKTLTLAVNLEVDGSSLNGTFTFSTVKYVSKLLGTAGVTVAEQTLAKDMLAYVKSAYAYFNSEDKDAVTAQINAVLGGYDKTEIDRVQNGAIADNDDIIDGVTFSLGATPAIRFYINADADEYTFKVGDSLVASEDIATGSDADGNYVDISLLAYKMISDITVECANATATYHINEYYDGVDKSDTALVDIVTKFYNYCASASKYRNSVIGE